MRHLRAGAHAGPVAALALGVALPTRQQSPIGGHFVPSRACTALPENGSREPGVELLPQVQNLLFRLA